MKLEAVYFVERKSKSDILLSEILEWTLSFSSEKTIHIKNNLEKTSKDPDSYYNVRSMIITD